MKIQSIIRRAGGSTVKLGDKTYRFTPENDHTCEVEDEAHIDRLLSIKEGFREAPETAERQPKGAKADGEQGEGKGDGEQQDRQPGESGGEAKAARKPRQPRQPKAAKAESKAAAE